MMLRKISIIVLILVNTPLVSAWMIEADVSPHQGNENTLILVNYSLNETITSDARVKVYLNAYDPEENGFDYKIDETIMDYFNVDPDNLSPITLSLNYASGFYRICLKLAHDGKYYQDCDSGNQFLLIKAGQQTKESTALLFVESPTEVYVNEEFVINVTLSNTGADDLGAKVYSYLHNGTEIIASSNSEQIILASGASTSLSLINKAPVQGNYTLVVRAKSEDSVSVEKELLAKPRVLSNIFLNDLVLINNTLRLCISNPGDVEELVTLRLYSSTLDFEKEVVVEPKRSYEELVNTSPFNGMVYVVLYRQGLLIDEKDVLVNNTLEPVDLGNNLITEGFQPREILLYSLIIVFSVATLLKLI